MIRRTFIASLLALAVAPLAAVRRWAKPDDPEEWIPERLIEEAQDRFVGYHPTEPLVIHDEGVIMSFRFNDSDEWIPLKSSGDCTVWKFDHAPPEMFKELR